MVRHTAAARVESGARWKPLYTEPGSCSFGVWQNLLIAVWHKGGTGDTVRQLMRAGSTVEGKYSAIHVINSGAGLPTPDGRAALVELLQQRTGKLACLAVVLRGKGFWASALQSTVTGLQLVVPKAFKKLRIFETLDEAAEWLSKEHGRLTGVELDPSDLRSVLKSAVSIKRAKH
jgi:hypothetical protein